MNETYDDVMLKANIMGGMNEYIKNIGDDDVYDIWISVFPDCCDEEELMEMAKDEDTWLAVVNCFARCLKFADMLK